MISRAEMKELQTVYEEIDSEGKKGIIKMAGKFMEVQKMLDDEKVEAKGMDVKNELEDE